MEQAAAFFPLFFIKIRIIRMSVFHFPLLKQGEGRRNAMDLLL